MFGESLYQQSEPGEASPTQVGMSSDPIIVLSVIQSNDQCTVTAVSLSSFILLTRGEKFWQS